MLGIYVFLLIPPTAEIKSLYYIALNIKISFLYNLVIILLQFINITCIKTIISLVTLKYDFSDINHSKVLKLKICMVFLMDIGEIIK